MSKDYIQKAEMLNASLQSIKQRLGENLQDVKVGINRDTNPDLYQSVHNIFGERDEISLEMYLHCLQIVKLASKQTGNDLIRARGI